MCNNSGLLGTLSLVKRIILLIQIIVPIILIGSVIISLIKLLHNPEEKNGTKKIINQFIAAIIVFFIPLLVNVVMNIAGDNTDFSSCWNSASDKITLNKGYIKFNEKDRRKVTYDAKDYEKGSGTLDFSCTSKKVKAQFSCETLPIIEKHLYDFDATNFNQKIASYGGFEKYAKSVGGIFGEYYGKKMPNETESDFQRAAEYVLGWMYMYGWDYMNGSGQRGACKGKDCFYANGGFEGKFIADPGISSAGLGIGNDYDHIISGKNGGPGRMASECGDLESFTFNKLGIKMDSKLNTFTRFKNLKVGDAFCMWSTTGEQKHNVVVGEVYDDRVVFYDTGTYYPNNRNYKRVAYLPKTDSVEADREVLKKVFSYYDSWGTRRHYNFKKG